MEHNEQNAPIRIVKKKGGHGGHHGGAWKVAYADFVTAMMALFIVLWIVGQSKQVKEYVAQYFKDPGAFMENTRGGGVFEFNKMMVGERISEDLLRRQQDSLRLANMEKEIADQLAGDKGLKELAAQVKLEIVREGLRIELLDKSESFFFDVGTATLKPDAQAILSVIAAELEKLPNKIIIEGHTDGRPYSRADGYSNFELSAERANSARRLLVSHGVTAKRIDEVRGCADSRLKNPRDPFDVTNRRISIIVKFAEGVEK
jgi:chemotaxis protein MotB